jgi:hypothetical protein
VVRAKVDIQNLPKGETQASLDYQCCCRGELLMPPS